MKSIAARGSLVLPLLIAACASPPAKPPAATHISEDLAGIVDTASIPSPVQNPLAPPRPKAAPKTETYSVVVNNVRVHDLLFALARDAKVNVDIHPGLQGSVTLNAVEQTLPQILNRLARQLDLRWDLDGQTLSVMPDSPYLHNYRIDYVNMNRDTSGSIQVSGEIAASGSASSGAAASNNGSTTKIENATKNRFWDTLILNIKDILRETDKILPEGSSDTVVEQESSQQAAIALGAPAGGSGQSGARNSQAAVVPQQSSGTTTIKRATFREAASVIAHPESGTIAVRATARQHEKIQEFLDQVMASAKRQVLIEATIAEVELSQKYEQGIDWGRVASSANANGFTVSQAGAGVTGSGLLTLGARTGSGEGSFSAAIRLLETFGTTKVLSSPKINAINNQSAILKVVDNQVYFNVRANTVTNTSGPAVTTFTTEQKVVPVGFVMNLTPQISENDEVVLNVRPSITRILKFEEDPNPSLVTTNPATGVQTKIANPVPVIRTREMESVIRLQNGNIAIMGGLMEDEIKKVDSGVPWFHGIPVLGALFSQKSSSTRKTELVIFLRPTIVRDASMTGDLARLRQHLPSKDFFNNNKETRFQLLPSDDAGGEKK